MNIFSSIRSQASLPQGWNYGVCRAPTSTIIEGALELCSGLLKKGYREADIEDFPYGNGAIEITVSSTPETSFIVTDRASIRVRRYINEEYVLVEERANLEQAIELTPRKECTLFVTYMSEISEKSAADISGAVVFATQMAVGYPWLSSIAPFENRDVYAVTPMRTTENSPVLLQYYSSSFPAKRKDFLSTPESSSTIEMNRVTTTSRGLTPKKPILSSGRRQIPSMDGYGLADQTDLSRLLTTNSYR
jgi:hypothetical protein